MNSLSFLRSTSRLLLGFRQNGAELVVLPQVLGRRHKGYYKSRTEGPPELYTQVEKSFAEWKFVERLLAPKLIPEVPKDPEAEYPSGWKPQNPEAIADLPYYIRRTKNGMMPVYYRSYNRGQSQTTRIRNIEGNVWMFEKEMGKFLKRKYPHKSIITIANEVGRYVQVRGDYEALLKEWLLDKGF